MLMLVSGLILGVEFLVSAWRLSIYRYSLRGSEFVASVPGKVAHVELEEICDVFQITQAAGSNTTSMISGDRIYVFVRGGLICIPVPPTADVALTGALYRRLTERVSQQDLGHYGDGVKDAPHALKRYLLVRRMLLIVTWGGFVAVELGFAGFLHKPNILVLDELYLFLIVLLGTAVIPCVRFADDIHVMEKIYIPQNSFGKCDYNALISICRLSRFPFSDFAEVMLSRALRSGLTAESNLSPLNHAWLLDIFSTRVEDPAVYQVLQHWH